MPGTWLLFIINAMIKKGLLIPLLSIILGSNAIGQVFFPEKGPLFNDTIVPRIDILIDPDSLDAIFIDVESDHEYPATFILHSGSTIDTIENVGFRLRGNTSRHSAKKSYKISFNTFIPGKKYYGVEKLNINGEHNDPSVIRSKLCWDILREFDIAAPRSNHVQLYVNQNYYGLYINVEHIDEEFVDTYFRNQDGNLYKCLWPADLNYISQNPDDYKLMADDRRVYDLKTNIEKDNYQDFADFIYILTNTPNTSLACSLEKVFNVEDYLKILAVDVISGNWDGYPYNKNNFYLYHNTETGKFEYIPYDLDNTLGIDWLNRDWGPRNIYDWAQHGNTGRPLYTRILNVPEYRDRFSHYINLLVTEIMKPETYFPYIDSIRNMIFPYITGDPFYPLDYNFSISDFNNSYDQALNEFHVAYGLKPYISTRINSAISQLESYNMIPAIKYIQYDYAPFGSNIPISANVDDGGQDVLVDLVYTINQGNEIIQSMKDDGTGSDQVAGDNNYSHSLDPVYSESYIDFQIRVSDAEGNILSTKPCEKISIHIFESSDVMLVINEFMAGNDFTIADAYEEYDDWLEIYNPDTYPVWLGNKYLTDNLTLAEKWLMPDSILAPGAFILIWADDQGWQGSVHANFKLSKDGEEIGLFESPAYGSNIIDQIVFDLQTDDISYGRETDGSSLWISFSSPTPGYSNTGTSSENFIFPESELKVYPNPVQDGMLYFNKMITVEIYDLWGRLLIKRDYVNSLRMDDLGPGIYILKTDKGSIRKIIVQ